MKVLMHYIYGYLLNFAKNVPSLIHMHAGSLWQYTHLIHPSEAFFSKHKWNCVLEGGRFASNRDQLMKFSLSSGQSRSQCLIKPFSAKTYDKVADF